jgi:hypothetical protein
MTLARVGVAKPWAARRAPWLRKSSAYLRTTLLEIANKLINAFSGPLFGIYLLAMFSRGATSGPVLFAGIAGTLTSYSVAYETSIGFMWPSTFGLAATLLVGGLLSVVLGTRASAEAQKLTWWEVTRSATAASPSPSSASLKAATR